MHDGRLKKISAPTVVINGTTAQVSVQVRNDGDHAETFGVYADILPPGNGNNPFGCTPTGRIIDTVVSLGIGVHDKQAVVSATNTFSCTDAAGAEGLPWTVIAVVDVHADDGGACGPGQLLSITCFNALADDDDNDFNHRTQRDCCELKLS